MNEWCIHSFAVSIFLIVPRPISEFKCSARLVWRELSRIVCPCPRARYLLSSPDSHIIMPTPSLSKSIWLASADTTKLGPTKLGSSLDEKQGFMARRAWRSEVTSQLGQSCALYPSPNIPGRRHFGIV